MKAVGSTQNRIWTEVAWESPDGIRILLDTEGGAGLVEAQVSATHRMPQLRSSPPPRAFATLDAPWQLGLGESEPSVSAPLPRSLEEWTRTQEDLSLLPHHTPPPVWPGYLPICPPRLKFHSQFPQQS